MPIKYLIITGANTAREINDLGDEYPVMEHFPEETTPAQFNRYLFEWARNKSSLKGYRIISVYIHSESNDEFNYSDWGPELSSLYPVGTKVECQVDEVNLTCIIL